MSQSALPAVFIAFSLQLHGLGQDWVSLFDGQTLTGWQPSENKSTWKVQDGTLVSGGGRSHLFYSGAVQNHEFKNFELEAEVRTQPGANSGIYLHTHYQESGFPETGYECQVINSNPNRQPGAYVERKMTGSIYAIRNVWKAPAHDNEWFRYRITVQGKTIRTFINEVLMADYTESENDFRPSDKKGRLLSSGTFALQGHDPDSVVAFRNLRVKVLPDDLPTPGIATDDRDFDATIIQLSNDNFPLLDLDVRPSKELTLDRALAQSRRFGYTYGFVFRDEVPPGFHKPPQAYVGLSISGADPTRVTADLSRGIDYVMADPIGQAAAETPAEDPQRFMDRAVARIEQLAGSGQVQIWARATALPDSLQANYDALWSPARMDRVIQALKQGKVAMEINDRLHLPSASFIRRAKAAGVRFTFGSDNTGESDLGKLDYGIAMIKQCKLTANDLWSPE